jgi:hypothetical protein
MHNPIKSHATIHLFSPISSLSLLFVFEASVGAPTPIPSPSIPHAREAITNALPCHDLTSAPPVSPRASPARGAEEHAAGLPESHHCWPWAGVRAPAQVLAQHGGRAPASKTLATRRAPQSWLQCANRTRREPKPDGLGRVYEFSPAGAGPSARVHFILDGLVGYAGPKFKKKPNHMGLVIATKAVAKQSDRMIQ